MKTPILSAVASLAVLCCLTGRVAAEGEVDYSKQIAPLLTKYCAGCHNADDREGKFSVGSFADLQKGGEHGRAILPGDSKSSRMIRMLTGGAKPIMPPEDSERPTAAEIDLLKAWIDGGAKGPQGREPDRTQLITPRIPPSKSADVITAIDRSADGKWLAVARFQEVEVLSAVDRRVVRRLTEHPGKVVNVRFSRDSKKLVTSSGIAGLYGLATIWDVATGKPEGRFQGHRDILFSAELSGDGQMLATAGYDGKVLLWDARSGKLLRALTGHNDAVYDLAFSPDNRILATASGDETVKLWRVDTGLRLDTLGQPLEEQYVVRFSPDGKYVVAGGADNRIRVWRVVVTDKPRINPLVYARFAHEFPIVQIAFSGDGRTLVSVAEDRTVKLWETARYTQLHAYPAQPDSITGAVISADNKSVILGRMDGQLVTLPVIAAVAASNGNQTVAAIKSLPMPAKLAVAKDIEPNDTIDNATPIDGPSLIEGAINLAGRAGQTDVDVFRIQAQAGQQWIFEVDAARSKSPLDSYLQVLSADGQPVPRVLLKAVRDSYFTFRGKDSNTSGDFRVHNWQEMELNEYLYAGGEVVKLWHYPRGPDSGFLVYPGKGSRYTYFDTTATAHALQAPCYIVEPRPVGSTIIPNGLPVFTIYYENDDDSKRRWGSDSKLTFTAPVDGTYYLRIKDVRGFEGSSYKYKLTVRPPRPDFTIRLVSGANPTVNAASGKEFSLRAERKDGYEGEIRIDISNLPPGFHATNPMIIQAGQETAFGVIHADAGAKPPTPELAKASKILASATIRGVRVTHDVSSFGEIKLAPKPKLLVQLHPPGPAAGADPKATKKADSDGSAKPLELAIAPGQTIMAKVRIERNGFKGRVSFGNEDAGRNLPHGVYVDNIGLNGLLIVEGNDERDFFITAAKWVPEGRRVFHVRTTVEGGQTSQPVILHIRK